MSYANQSVSGPSLLSRLQWVPPTWWFHWGWWIWITITCCMLSAHLVALGTSLAWYALILCVLALHAAWYWDAHSRFIAWAYGFAFAFYILVAVEIYLGATGLYYGAIGSMNRPHLPGDKVIVSAFEAFYRFGNDYRSLLSWLGSIVLYVVLGLVLSRTSVSRIADWLACVLAVLYVLLAFPFAHPFEAKQVGIRDAMFESSAALRDIGSYDAAAKEVAKESDLLERLSSQLEDPRLAEKRKELSDEVRRYAAALAVLDERKRQKVVILRQPEKNYQSRSALPTVQRRYPPHSEPDFSPKGAAEQASNVNPDNILNAWLLTRQARELADKAKHDQARGIASFQDIHDYVGGVVIDQIGNRTDLVEVADRNVLQIIALHDLEGAINELKQRTAELDAEIRNQEQRNAELERNVTNFATRLANEMEREADCADTLREVATWLNGEGRSVLRTIGDRFQQARTRLEGRQPSLPVNLVPEGVNEPLITNEVTRKLVEDNRWPPRFTREEMRKQLLTVSDGGAAQVSGFADAMCKAGRNSADIERELQAVADSVRVPEKPRAPSDLR